MLMDFVGGTIKGIEVTEVEVQVHKELVKKLEIAQAAYDNFIDSVLYNHLKKKFD